MKSEPALPDRELLTGLVERVTYQSAENGFCVLRVKARVTGWKPHRSADFSAEWCAKKLGLNSLPTRPATSGLPDRDGRRARRPRDGRPNRHANALPNPRTICRPLHSKLHPGKSSTGSTGSRSRSAPTDFGKGREAIDSPMIPRIPAFHGSTVEFAESYRSYTAEPSSLSWTHDARRVDDCIPAPK